MQVDILFSLIGSNIQPLCYRWTTWLELFTVAIQGKPASTSHFLLAYPYFLMMLPSSWPNLTVKSITH